LLWKNPHMHDATPNGDLREILPARIQQRLSALGKSKRAVSLAIGAHPGYIRDLFDPDRFNVPSALRLQAIARELQTTTEFLIGGANSPDPVTSEVSLSERHIEWHGPSPEDPGIPLVGTGDCAALAVCDTSGQMVEIER